MKKIEEEFNYAGANVINTNSLSCLIQKILLYMIIYILHSLLSDKNSSRKRRERGEEEVEEPAVIVH